MNTNFHDIEVDDTGYRNVQVVEGYLHISVPEVFTELTIDVYEYSAGNLSVDMVFSLEDNDEKENIINYFGDSIKYDEEFKVYKIVNNDIITDLFSQYGNNA